MTEATCSRPNELEDGEELKPEDGLIFIGDQGKILVDGWGGELPRLLPKSRMEGFTPPAPTLPPLRRAPPGMDTGLQRR